MHRPRRTKRQRTSEIKSLIGTVSDTTLSSISQAIAGLDPSSLGGLSRSIFSRATHDDVEALVERVEMQLTDGGEGVWALFEPSR